MCSCGQSPASAAPRACVEAQQHGAQHQQHAQRAAPRHRVPVHRARQQDRHRLAQRHDDGEDDGAEARDGVVDEQLPHRRAHRQHDHVRREHRVVQQAERRRVVRMRGGGEGAGEGVDGAEHVQRAAAVAREHGALPRRREAVRHHVQRQQRRARQRHRARHCAITSVPIT